jgi:hypothetical protein
MGHNNTPCIPTCIPTCRLAPDDIMALRALKATKSEAESKTG